jgi:beta-glucosidase
MTTFQFPPDFVWGTATSSYQIEGAAYEDGRGETIWDRFSHTPGKVDNGDTGDVACDHYHRWREDIALMKELRLQAYCFSFAWSRILPTGRGPVNRRGLDFYSRLIDGLLEAGVTPFPTIYHWDLPQALEDEGGWPARSTAEAFVEYADIVSREFGDRCKSWITHNEPWCVSMLSYQIGEHAPGRKEWPAALAAAHHVLLSHGWAVPVIRANSPGAEVGIILNFNAASPASDSPEDLDACRHFDGYFNRWFVEAVYRGEYPEDMVADYTARGYLPEGGAPYVQRGDMAAISVPIDFLGVNYYTHNVIGTSPQAQNRTAERTDMGWEIYPEGLYEFLVRLHKTYNPGKLYVTENGASYADGPGPDGRVRDARRTRFLHDHFSAAHRAISDGVPLAGYFVWSLMDNFEWAKGYAERFGIVWVDFETQQRIPKDSALWYRQVIEANGLPEYPPQY